MTLVTQNIDDFHPEILKTSSVLPKILHPRIDGSLALGRTPGVLEIHGNWRYMRCSNERECPSSTIFFEVHNDERPLPSLEELEADTF